MKPSYLQKQAFTEQLIEDEPSSNLGMVVVIPCFDEPDLLRSLQSLHQCEPTHSDVEIIVIINAGENASPRIIAQNQKTYDLAKAWSDKHSSYSRRFYILNQINLPTKHAGVGLARKIGMDEAVRRFQRAEKEDGIIICFDADSQCEINYLVELETHFEKYPKSPACAIYFEHPIEGCEFSPEIYKAIIDYELHLRYYVNALKFAAYPYAHQTIGSSMAVRSSAYQKQGGMNRRKAGEDFYFLSKMMPLGNFTELNSTCVIPSPRSSHRVPFGTGKAVQERLEAATKDYLTYSPLIFVDLKSFRAFIDQAYLADDILSLLTELPDSLRTFLANHQIETVIEEARKHSSSAQQFTKRCYAWFDNFRVLKFVHHARDNYHPNVEVGVAAQQLLHLLAKPVEGDNRAVLISYRALDRK